MLFRFILLCVLPGIFGQYDGIRRKRDARRELCGAASNQRGAEGGAVGLAVLVGGLVADHIPAGKDYAVFLPLSLPSTSANMGSNSLSSSTSAPMAEQPKAMAS